MAPDSADSTRLHQNDTASYVRWHSPNAQLRAAWGNSSVEVQQNRGRTGALTPRYRCLFDRGKHDPSIFCFATARRFTVCREHEGPATSSAACDKKGALEMMKLNAKAYPDSANVYDSLSDAYLAQGDNELALQNAKKALEALVSDTVDPEPRRDAIRESAPRKAYATGRRAAASQQRCV